MKGTSKDFWEERYREQDYVYGEYPNIFFQSELEKLGPASILLPADGEGRNSVFAAKKGWQVTAFDLSKAGKEKADKLAKRNAVEIKFEVTSAKEFDSDIKFEVIALIYAHFDAENRPAIHKHLLQFLKPGGILIFEAFSQKQLDYNSGGPKDLRMLFSKEEVRREFSGLTLEYLEELKIEQVEGKYHQGQSSVIRMVGKKI
ncbi:class I SAM-dependent methyltransferase [Gramella sp. AN32]|uniref:Class I SAM-dependent methyltransferase n=1 Tax=Christiangramia antarctica TaxID=2058158 RepID=A0ABW5X884_9FLAO|nr:class I SAM-dependent methyltransferase [Gramella sp. AN32]MCM4158126.1 SAM-dependent methyltransferase [Gramella sp. AN32]